MALRRHNTPAENGLRHAFRILESIRLMQCFGMTADFAATPINASVVETDFFNKFTRLLAEAC